MLKMNKQIDEYFKWYVQRTYVIKKVDTSLDYKTKNCEPYNSTTNCQIQFDHYNCILIALYKIETKKWTRIVTMPP